MKKMIIICLISIMFILSRIIIPHKYYFICFIAYFIGLIIISFIPKKKNDTNNQKTINTLFKKIVVISKDLRFESGNKIREEINLIFDFYNECSEMYDDTTTEDNDNPADKKLADALDALYDTLDLMVHKNFNDVKIIEDKCSRIKRLIREKFNVPIDEN